MKSLCNYLPFNSEDVFCSQLLSWMYIPLPRLMFTDTLHSIFIDALFHSTSLVVLHVARPRPLARSFFLNFNSGLHGYLMYFFYV